MSELGLTYFDIGALCVVIICLFVGISNGFLRELGKVITWIFSLIGAKILSVPLEPIIYEKLDIQGELLTGLNRIMDSVDFTSIESMRSSLESGLESLFLVGGLLKDITKNNWGITDIYQTGSANLKGELVDLLLGKIEPIAHYVLNVGCFIVLFILLFIICSIIVNAIINGVTSIKSVATVDKLAGGLLGIVKGSFLVLLGYSILFVVFSVFSSNNLDVLMNSKFFDIVVGIKEILPSA